MSEFGDLLKEALTGAETVPTDRGKQALEAAVAKFQRRERTVRWMAVIAVGFMSGLVIWAAVSFFRAPDDTPLRTSLLHVVAFLFGMSGIGFGKLWFAMMHDHLAVMKELKRMQLMLLDQVGTRS